MYVEYIKETQKLYSGLGFKDYEWARNTIPPPLQPLKKPLNRCRVSICASGGIYQAGQRAFHYRDDDSFRQISRDIDVGTLRATHFAYDLSDARRDPNCVFPIDPLRRMESEGFIGEIAPFLYTFMGGIYSQRKVKENLAPSITELLIRNQVDALLLVPC